MTGPDEDALAPEPLMPRPFGKPPAIGPTSGSIWTGARSGEPVPSSGRPPRAADRRAPSPRPFPAPLPEPADAPGEVLCRAGDPGRVGFRGRTVFVGHGLVGQTVAVRPEPAPGRFGVRLGDLRVVVFGPRSVRGVNPGSEHS